MATRVFKKIVTTGELPEGWHKVTMFRSLQLGVRELARFVVRARELQAGDELAKFGRLRPREMWGNWLVCAVMNAATGRERFNFMTDPTGGDGIIYDRFSPAIWPTEHVMEVGPHPKAPNGRGATPARMPSRRT